MSGSNEETEIKFYSKVTTDQNNDIFKWAIRLPIRAAVLLIIGARVRSSASAIEGLEKGEFVLSKAEYEKFGLIKSQSGQIERVLKDLKRCKIIEDTGKRTGSRGATIYRYHDNLFMDCSRSQRTAKQERDRNIPGNEEEGTKNETKYKSDIPKLTLENLETILKGLNISLKKEAETMRPLNIQALMLKYLAYEKAFNYCKQSIQSGKNVTESYFHDLARKMSKDADVVRDSRESVVEFLM